MGAYGFGLGLKCLDGCSHPKQARNMKDHPDKESAIVAAISRDQVEVDMRHMLVGRLTVVEQEVRAIDAEASSSLCRHDTVADREQVMPHRLIKLLKFLRMRFWNHQYMAAPHRVNIHESSTELIFMHMNGRFDSRSDPAEQTSVNILAHLCLLMVLVCMSVELVRDTLTVVSQIPQML